MRTDPLLQPLADLPHPALQHVLEEALHVVLVWHGLPPHWTELRLTVLLRRRPGCRPTVLTSAVTPATTARLSHNTVIVNTMQNRRKKMFP